MLRISGPGLGQSPALLQRLVIKRRPGIGHGGIEVGKFAVKLYRQLHGLAHGIEIVVRQAEDKISYDVDIRSLDFANDLHDVFNAEGLAGSVSDVMGPGFYSKRQPKKTGPA